MGGTISIVSDVMGGDTLSPVLLMVLVHKHR